MDYPYAYNVAHFLFIHFLLDFHISSSVTGKKLILSISKNLSECLYCYKTINRVVYFLRIIIIKIMLV